MLYVLDTSVAIQLRDGDDEVLARVEALDGDVCMSIVTRIELEGGVARRPGEAAIRRKRLDALLATVRCMPFDEDAAERYREIIEAAGFSRPRIIDRMIAAHALALDATVVTLNGKDFIDVPNLSLLAW